MDGSGDSCQNETRYCEQFLRVACYVSLSGFVRVDLKDVFRLAPQLICCGGKEVGYLKRLSEGVDLRQRRSEDEG